MRHGQQWCYWLHEGEHKHIRPPERSAKQSDKQLIDREVAHKPDASAHELRTGSLDSDSLPLSTINPALVNPRKTRYAVAQSKDRLNIATSTSSKLTGGFEFLKALKQLKSELGEPFIVSAHLQGPTFMVFQTMFMWKMAEQSVADWVSMDDRVRHQHGFVTDGSHSFFRQGSGILLATCVFSAELRAWVPVLYTWIEGLDAEHHRPHFNHLFGIVAEKVLRDGHMKDIRDRVNEGQRLGGYLSHMAYVPALTAAGNKIMALPPNATVPPVPGYVYSGPEVIQPNMLMNLSFGLHGSGYGSAHAHHSNDTAYFQSMAYHNPAMRLAYPQTNGIVPPNPPAFNSRAAYFATRTVDKPPIEEEMVEEQERIVDIRCQDGEEMVEEQERMVDVHHQDREEHHECDNETCLICSGPMSEVEGGTGQGTTGGGGKPPKKPKGSKGKKKKKKKRGSADPDDDSGSNFTVAHMKPRGGRGDKGKNKQVPANADEESGGGSPVARSQAASPIPGINDIHLSLSDNVSDTETAFGFRRMSKGASASLMWINGAPGFGTTESLEWKLFLRALMWERLRNLRGRYAAWVRGVLRFGKPVDHPFSCVPVIMWHESDRDNILHYVKSVMKSYVDGIPRHIACKIDLPSSMKVFSFSQWDTMSLASQSDLFSCFHILLYDCPHIRGGLFDEKTLGRFVHLDRQTTMTDRSLDPAAGDKTRQDSPRILNAIGTLLPPSPAKFEAHNLCDAAFDATQGSMGPGPSLAHHPAKIGSLSATPGHCMVPMWTRGGGTVVDTHVGGKLWMMLVPKWPNEGNGTPVTPKPEDYWRLFGQTRFWEAVTDGDDGIKELNNCHWEGVFATAEESSHPGMRIYIHRIIIFHYEYYCLGRQHHYFKHHLLDPTKADDMAQLQALLMLGILEDVFNPRSYELGRANAKRETNGEDLIGREPPRAVYTSYIKGISWTIVQWLTSCYSFSTTVMEGEEWRPLTIDQFKEEYWYTMVRMQLAALHTWRVHLVEKGVVGSVHDHAADEDSSKHKDSSSRAGSSGRAPS
ncbi:hypothetical protein BKA70DRAFT_1442729 [Coprinopsis sp. MPI-PUGE-AT-0042]|nr:hypothetical protein BKA70DRAFT_1442729 [Coprinopsis sp. MPI-PUGE-AT-0042]